MSQVDLIINATPPLPPSGSAQYARIDNTTNPVFSSAQTFTTVPYDLTPNGVPNGQYQIVVTPTYPDGRTCAPQTSTTAACPTMIAVSAVQTGNNIVVSYTAPSTGPNGQAITQVGIVITGPNGSSYSATFTNGTNSSQIVYPIPSGVYGAYVITMQCVCDSSTGFFGPASPAITINVASPIVNPVLNGTVTVLCPCPNEAGGLQFNLASVLSNDLTVQMAYQFHTANPSETEQQYGTSIIPPAYITGTAVATGYASFVIPAGVYQVTIPQDAIYFGNPVLGGVAQPLFCFCTSNALNATNYIDFLFFHPANQPSIAITLTAIDNRISVIQI